MKSKYQKLEESDAEAIAKGIPFNIFHEENLAIVMAYLSVGLVGSFLSTPLNVYLVEQLNAEPQMQNTIGILQTLPWSLKLLFGFLSDACPIAGMHRKPYLAIGALLYSSAFILYALIGRDDVILLSITTFIGTLGLIQLDVMADTMCVQRSKLEPEDCKGQMQSSCYSIRFAGSLIGAIMGATLCNQKSWGWGLNYFQVSFLNGLIPFVLVTPMLYTLKERYLIPKEMKEQREIELGVSHSSHNNSQHGHHHKIIADEHAFLVHDQHMSSSGYHSIPHIDIFDEEDIQPLYQENESKALPSDTSEEPQEHHHHSDDTEDYTQSISDQLNEIWETVQLKSVWQPMAFVYIFNLFQVPNVAWQSYLQLNLEFPPWILGMTVILGSFMTFAGVLGYKYFFFKSSWRSVYVWTVFLTAFFSFLQLVLIFQLNKKYLHLNNYLFSLGDDVISSYISGIQFLPLCIMYMRLCPDGAEGSSYAMLTTFGNIALVCASNLGNLLANVWDVSNDAMRNKDVNGLWKLNLLTSCLAIFPLTFLYLLPENPEAQEKLAKSKERSKLAGGIFLVVLLGSLTWTSITAIMRVMGSSPSDE